MNEALHFDVAQGRQRSTAVHRGRLLPAGVRRAGWPIGCSASIARDHRRRHADDARPPRARRRSAAVLLFGLVLLACGSGLLKPNVSTLVGNLYRDRPELRDQGFNIFYMGINLGAFISPLTVAWLRTHYGWSVAFMSAAVAMLISLVVFIEASTGTSRTPRSRWNRPRRRSARRPPDEVAIARRSRCWRSSSSRWCSGSRSTRSSTRSRSGRATTRDLVDAGDIPGVRAARRDPAVARAGRALGRGCSGATPSRRRR